MNAWKNMTKEAFKRAMTAGLGRCRICLMTGDKERYRDVVQYGCLTNFSYDTQSNGTAERYVYSLVKCYDDPLSFLPPLTEKFERLDLATVCDWDLLYYARLLTLFAADGAADAVNAVRRRYEDALKVLQNPTRVVEGYVDYDEENYTILGTALLEADGKDAYVKVASDLNDLNLRFHIRCLDLPWLVSAINDLPDFVEYVKQNAREDLSAFLADYEIARQDEYGSYEDEEVEDAGEEIEEGSPEITRETAPIDPAKEAVSFEPFYEWAACCEDPRLWERYPEVVKLADEARARASKILKELDRFDADPDGAPFDLLSRYADHCDRDVREAAQDLIARRTDEAVIALARERLGAKGPEWWTLYPLICGYKPEYEGLLTYMLNKLRFEPEEGDHWHAIVCRIAELAVTGEVDLPQSILTVAYERSLCRHCRREILEALYRKGYLSSEMKEECLFDANEEIVRFATEHGFAASGSLSENEP